MLFVGLVAKILATSLFIAFVYKSKSIWPAFVKAYGRKLNE